MGCFDLACLGCGVGIGAAASRLWQQKPAARRSALQTKARGTPARESQGGQEVLLHQSLDEQCQWLNSLVSILWPRIDEFLNHLVESQIMPAINDALPHLLRGSVKIERCSLGNAAPSFTRFKVKERTNKAIVLEIDVDVLSDLDVQIKVLHLPLGIREFDCKGVVTVVLEPPSSLPPFFGGVEVYFVNPPVLDFDFTGAADVADLKVVKSALQKTIRNQLKNIMVVPSRIAIDLKPDDATGVAELKFPEPIGALRILVKRASDLKAADMAFPGMERTSDPYVHIEVGQQTWKSGVVKGTCNPVWEHGNVQDFLVYDSGQHITFEVYDWDRIGADDFLGSVKDIPIEHFALSGQVMDEKLEVTSEEGPAGSLVISTRWFGFTHQVPSKGIHQAVARGPHQLFLAVKVEDAHELPADSHPPFTVRVTVGKEYTEKTRPSQPPKGVLMQEDLSNVCLRLQRRGMPLAEIAQVVGLDAVEVGQCIQMLTNPDVHKQLRQAKSKREAAQHPTWNEIVRLLLPWTSEVINEKVCLELHDASGRCVGTRVELSMALVVGQEMHGPFAILPGAAIRASLSTKWFCLP